MLVSARSIYESAKEGGYAVGGFVAEHLAMVKAIIDAAVETKSPTIIFLWDNDIKRAGNGFLEAMVRKAAIDVPVPIAMMLDHGMTLHSCLQAMMNGHSGVMYDGSHYPFEENIAHTRRVVDIAHELDVIVEGELGTIPRTFESCGPYAEKLEMTPIELVTEYVQRSGIDSLAVSIGNESGHYRSKPMLDFDRLETIARMVPHIFLTLHGGSGISENDVRQAVKLGIRSIRYATELRDAFFGALDQARKELPPGFADTWKLFSAGATAAKECIAYRMSILGCAGKAR